METRLADFIRNTPAGEEADRILRACVHCGFCNATCPTYQVLGDELDGPRGRIYQIKQVLEGQPAQVEVQTHLDRCLTCLNCETTCPSGVQYRHLLEIGRTVVDRQLGRSRLDRLARRGLRILLTTPQLFSAALKTGRWFAPLLPKKLRQKIPAKQVSGARPSPRHNRKVVLVEGCVQAIATPRTNAAAARVLDRLGITAVSVAGETCCGAASLHLGGSAEARRLARKNIDAWAATLEEGAEAIVSTASGCGVMIKDYAHLLADDADYADKAARVADATRDLGEVIADEDLSALKIEAEKRIAFQSPCSLQHGQKLSGKIESILSRLGFELTPVNDSHLCCGSAGTYSILQPTMAATLRQRKLDNLCRHQPQVIATANIGCQLHLAGDIPVRHWVELLDSHFAA